MTAPALLDPALIGDAEVLVDTGAFTYGQWVAARTATPGLGGSDASVVAGLNPWKSAFELWVEKTTGQSFTEDNEAMAWGRILEDPVRREVARREAIDIEVVNAILCHPTRRWQLANIDGGVAIDIDGQPAIYEGKTCGPHTAHEWDDDQVPEHYVLQGQHYLAVTGLPRVLYACLMSGQQLVVRRVERDAELIDLLISMEAEFWGLVQEKRPPALDGSAACTEFVKRLHATARPDAVLVVDDADEVRALLAERRAAAATAKAAQELVDALDNQLRVLAGDHEIVQSDDGQRLFTFKEVTTTRPDGGAFAKAFPSDPDTFTTSTHRRLYIPKGPRQ